MKKYVLVALCALGLNGAHAQTWEDIGSQGFSTHWSYDQVLEYDGTTPYVAYQDFGENQSVVVQKFDGTSWSQVGINASSDNINYLSFAIHNGTPYIAFDDEDNGSKLTVRKFDGTSWVTVGTPGISTSNIYLTSIAFDGDTLYVAYADDTEYLSIQKFDGTSWSSYASNLSNWSVDDLKMQFSSGIPYLLFHEYENNSNLAKVITFDGQSWSELPAVSNQSTSSGNKDLAIYNDVIFVAFNEASLNSALLKVKSYNPATSTWGLIGTGPVTDSLVNYMSLTVDQGIPYVAYKEVSTSNLIVRKFNGIDWDQVGMTNRQSFHSDIRIDPVTFQPIVAFSDAPNGEQTSVIRLQDVSNTPELSSLPIISIAPNPAESLVQIDGKYEMLTIFNLAGELVRSYPKDQDYIDVSTLENGIYLLRFTTENGLVTKRVIKR